jgi:hypothetical protein
VRLVIGEKKELAHVLDLVIYLKSSHCQNDDKESRIMAVVEAIAAANMAVEPCRQTSRA